MNSAIARYRDTLGFEVDFVAGDSPASAGEPLQAGAGEPLRAWAREPHLRAGAGRP